MKTAVPHPSIEPLEARIAPATFLVTNTLDSGPGSLRQAIINANLLNGTDTIGFAIPAWSVIKPLTHLPAITQTVIINGFVDGGYTTIDGSLAIGSDRANNGSGLMLSGSDSRNSSISGLAIYGFDLAGIEIVDSSANRVFSNYLGVDPLGRPVETTMAEGILIKGGGSNEIGLSGGNVIGGNLYGIRLVGGTGLNRIDGNTIGFGKAISPDSLAPNDVGIFVESANNTRIGVSLGNTIAGNDTFGIKLASAASLTTIVRNKLGLASDSQWIGNQEWGIFVDGAINTTIGQGSITGIDGNVISGNSAGGIWVRSFSSNSTTNISGNRIGVTSDGLSLPSIDGENHFLGNGGSGILLTGSSISDSSSRVTISKNLVSGNAGPGIELRNYGSNTLTTISGNLIGTDKLGTSALGNGEGIRVDGSRYVLITGNTVAASDGDGLLVRSSTTVTITSNKIGFAPLANETNGFGNAGHGVHVVTSSATIGSATGQNTITSNGGDGILIETSTVKVLNNLVGTDGTKPMGNSGSGIHIKDIYNESVQIGDSTGTIPTARNIIGGNGEAGILIERSTGVGIYSNYIGTDSTGLAALGNHGNGIELLDARLTKIQGATVSGNFGNGITITGKDRSAEDNSIASTFVGLTVDGLTPLLNSLSGILIDGAYSLTVGGFSDGNFVLANGTALDLRNAIGAHISSNDFRSLQADAVVIEAGMSVSTAVTWRPVIIDNGPIASSLIDNTVTSDIGIAVVIKNGIYMGLTQNRFQAAVAGVVVHAGEDIVIARNHYTIGTGGLFVDLGGDGPTPNDHLDEDSGPNTLLNSPLLVSAAVRGEQTLLRGEYRGAANSDLSIDWYVNGSFLTDTLVHTDENGLARLALDLGQAIELGAQISASATNVFNSSEASPAVIVTTPPEVVAKGAAVGQKPRVQLYDSATGNLIWEQLAFGKALRGGVSVTTLDVDNDGFADVIATPRTGNTTVKVFSGLDGHVISAYQAGIGGNTIRRIAAGDLDGDGQIELILGHARSVGGLFAVHDALTGALESNHMPFGSQAPKRLSFVLSDTDGDGLPEVAISAKVRSAAISILLDPLSGQIEELARIVRA